MLRVTRAKIDPSDQATVVNTFLVILRYNIMATNNAIEVLGANPSKIRQHFIMVLIMILLLIVVLPGLEPVGKP